MPFSPTWPYDLNLDYWQTLDEWFKEKGLILPDQAMETCMADNPLNTGLLSHHQALPCGTSDGALQATMGAGEVTQQTVLVSAGSAPWPYRRHLICVFASLVSSNLIQEKMKATATMQAHSFPE